MRIATTVLISGFCFGSIGFSTTVYSVSPFTIPGSEIVVLNQINDSGEIAGTRVTKAAGPPGQAFVVSAGGNVQTVLSEGEAFGINNLGQVTGFGPASNTAFIYNPNGTITYFSGPGDVLGIIGEGINDAGDVVGDVEYKIQGASVSYQDHGFIRTPNGSLTIFDVPNGTNHTYARGINDMGEIVGYYYDNSGPPHGFILNSNGTGFTSFDVCNYGPVGTYAYAVNNRGEVAGFCGMKSGEVGFIREANGSFSTYGFDANPAFGDITNTDFFGINDEDVVTGTYLLDGRGTSFIATPIPEPSTLLVTVILLVAIPLVRQR
jgi:hypothetical protein